MKSTVVCGSPLIQWRPRVGPDGGHYIGQHLLIDRFLGSRRCRVNVLLLGGPDQCGGTAGALDGVLVARRLTSAPWTRPDLDDATGDRTDLLADQLGYVGMRTRLSEQS